jgi:hypothetical protein
MSWLPNTAIQPAFDPSHLRILLYGRGKIGKSTWCASFPDAIFMCPEQGHEHLEVKRIDIIDWAKTNEPKTNRRGVIQISCLGFIKELEDNPNLYKTVVVDTADRLFKMCQDHVCEDKSIEHPQDLGYGKGWDLLNTEFRKAVMRLTSSGRGVIFISHTKTKFVSIGEHQAEKFEPTLSNGAASVIVPEVDLILRADYAINEQTGDTHRVIMSAGDTSGVAGSRWSLPPMFPMTIRGGYQKLLGYLTGGETVPAKTQNLKINLKNIKLKTKKD